MIILKRMKCCLCILVAVLVLSSCQPTPDEVPVTQKADVEQVIAQQAKENDEKEVTASDEEEVTASDEEAKYEYDELWNETYTSDAINLSIEANVEVEVPDVDAFPVMRVFKGEYDRTKVMEIINYFASDAKFSFEPIQRTKDELTELLVEAKRGQLIDGEYVVNEESQRVVEDLKIQIAEAPKTIETEFVGIDEIENLEEFSLNVSQKNGDDSFIKLSKESKGLSLSRFMYSADCMSIQTESLIQSLTMDDIEEWWLPIELVADIKESGVKEIGDVDIPVEEAQEVAQNLLNQFQIEDRPLAHTEKVVIFDGDKHLASKGYEFVFMPELGGLNGIYVHNEMSVREPAYAAPFPLEQIKITVDENGKVQFFYWDYICKMGDIMTENLEIMPFEDMKATIIKQIGYNYSYDFVNMQSREDLEYEIKIDIDEVRLGCCLTAAKDNPQQALLVPAWSVSVEALIKCGSTDTQSGEGSGNENFFKEQMVFGSVDGLIIDLKGY